MLVYHLDLRVSSATLQKVVGLHHCRGLQYLMKLEDALKWLTESQYQLERTVTFHSQLDTLRGHQDYLDYWCFPYLQSNSDV